MNSLDQNSTLIHTLNGILAQWTTPTFTTAVAAREGLILDSAALALLSIINNDGPLRPSALAERMGTGASNISKIFARLQEAGLAERLGDPADSRAFLIGLTAAGEQAGQAVRRSGHSLIDDMLEDWSEQDRDTLVRLLSQFNSESKRVAADLRNNSGD